MDFELDRSFPSLILFPCEVCPRWRLFFSAFLTVCAPFISRPPIRGTRCDIAPFFDGTASSPIRTAWWRALFLRLTNPSSTWRRPWWGRWRRNWGTVWKCWPVVVWRNGGSWRRELWVCDSLPLPFSCPSPRRRDLSLLSEFSSSSATSAPFPASQHFTARLGLQVANQLLLLPPSLPVRFVELALVVTFLFLGGRAGGRHWKRLRGVELLLLAAC